MHCRRSIVPILNWVIRSWSFVLVPKTAFEIKQNKPHLIDDENSKSKWKWSCLHCTYPIFVGRVWFKVRFQHNGMLVWTHFDRMRLLDAYRLSAIVNGILLQDSVCLFWWFPRDLHSWRIQLGHIHVERFGWCAFLRGDIDIQIWWINMIAVIQPNIHGNIVHCVRD